MAKSYINADSKQAIYSLFGVKAFYESLLADPVLPEQKVVTRQIKAALNQTQKVIDNTMDAIDPDAAAGLFRWSKDVELVCMSKADPRGQGDYIVVKADEVMRVLSSNHECLFCEKRGKEAEKCDLRKIGMLWQLIPKGKGECPFWRDY